MLVSSLVTCGCRMTSHCSIHCSLYSQLLFSQFPNNNNNNNKTVHTNTWKKCFEDWNLAHVHFYLYIYVCVCIFMYNHLFSCTFLQVGVSLEKKSFSVAFIKKKPIYFSQFILILCFYQFLSTYNTHTYAQVWIFQYLLWNTIRFEVWFELLVSYSYIKIWLGSYKI